MVDIPENQTQPLYKKIPPKTKVKWMADKTWALVNSQPQVVTHS